MKLNITVVERRTAQLDCDSYEQREEIGAFLKSKKFHRGTFSEPDYALVSSGNRYYVEMNDGLKNLDKMIAALKKKYDIQETVTRTSSQKDLYKMHKAAEEILKKWNLSFKIQKIAEEILKRNKTSAKYITWDKIYPILEKEEISTQKRLELHNKIPDWGVYPDVLEKMFMNILKFDYTKANQLIQNLK